MALNIKNDEAHRLASPFAKTTGTTFTDAFMRAWRRPGGEIALETLLDLGRHVLAKGFGDVPAEYREVARQLGARGVLVNQDRSTARLRRSVTVPMLHSFHQ